MSDADAPTPSPSAPPPETGQAPRPVSTPAVVDVEMDRSLISHLGLPFYYRHTPVLWMRRVAFWAGFLFILGLLGLNLVMMPFGTETVLYAIRIYLFGGWRWYATFEDAGRGISYQFLVIAILISTVIAPLFATFSLSGERVTGTMEFLRLAPLSTTSIVLGKMFAPAYPLHLFSATLLALGCAAGLLSGLRAQDVLFTLAVVVLTAATLHAFGAYLACTSLHFRGFAPVGGLVGLGWTIHVLPLPAGEIEGMRFLEYVSPWGALDGFFWHGISGRWGVPLRAEFCGSQMLVFPFVLAAHLLLFALFVRAAGRKLEHPERPALSPSAWMALWGFVLATALGASLNRYRFGTGSEGWACAAAVLGVPSFIICCGILLDHPHRREVALASECERVAGGTPPSSTVRRLAHALFVMALTSLATVLVIAFLCLYRTPPRESWGWIAVCAFLPALLAFLGSLALEFAFVGFETNWARMAVGAAALGALAFVAIAPVVDSVSSYDRFRRTLWIARSHYMALPGQSGPKGTVFNAGYFERQLASPEYQVYGREMRSLDDVNRLDREYGSNILAFFWHFRPLAVLSYAALALGCIVALVLCRAWAYRSVRREAERAARGNGLPRDGPMRLPRIAQT